MTPAVHLRPEDNVAIAAKHMPEGQTLHVSGRTVTLVARIGFDVESRWKRSQRRPHS
jgi:hypothetical protein